MTAVVTEGGEGAVITSRGLSIRDVHAWYGQMQVLFGANLRVDESEIVGLIGHNGSGKTTLLRVVAGLHRRAAYTVALHGDDLTGLEPHVIARRGLATVRGAQVFEGISVEQHLMLGGRLARLGGRESNDIDHVYEQIPVLHRLRGKLGPELSGGQRQLLTLGMAFMANPRAMILDEPTTGLDVAARNAIADILRVFAKTGVPMLLVEQNPSWLADVAQRAYLIELGRIVAEGEPLSLLGPGSHTTNE